MSRYVGKNSTESKVASVRAGAREVMFKPAAHRWLQPGLDGAPAFQNSWAQVGGSVERFAYRLNSDGKLEVKGHLSAAAAASGTVVTTVPDAILVPVSVEPSYRLSDHVERTVPVTADGGTTYVPGTIVVDNATGQLKVFYGGGHPWIRRRMTGVDSISAGSQQAIDTYNDVVGSTDYLTYFSIFSISQIQVLTAGIYIVACQFLWQTFPENRVLVLNDGYSNSLGFDYDREEWGGETSMHGFTMMHRYPANQTILLSAQHGNATAKTVGPGYFEIMRIGSYTGTDPSSAEE